MPVDPALQAFLDALAAEGLPPIDEQPLDLVRAGAGALVAAHAAPAEPVERVEDRELVTDVGPIRARVYTPAGCADPAPLVAYFHGGGWVFMGIDTHDFICRRLANASGAVVVNLEYRLAPEHRFPAAVDDCDAATRWLGAHARELGGDPGRLVVAGDSAGGNLAAAVVRRARDAGPALAAQVLVYPVCDASFDTASYRDNADGYLLTERAMRWFWSCYLGPDGDPTDPEASPLRATDLAGLPPALVITAEYDPLRDEGDAYARALAAAGVPVEHRSFAGMIHGFLGMDALTADADVAMAAIGQYLRDPRRLREARPA